MRRRMLPALIVIVLIGLPIAGAVGDPYELSGVQAPGCIAPLTTFRVFENLTALTDIKGVWAALHADNMFVLNENYVDNILFGDMLSSEVAEAEWFVSAPHIEGAYTISVEWYVFAPAENIYYLDNHTMSVSYCCCTTPVDPRMTEDGFYLLLIIAYALMLYGMFGRMDNNQQIVVLMLAMLFLFLSGVVSIMFDNHAIGLLNIGLAFMVAGIAVIKYSESLPNV